MVAHNMQTLLSKEGNNDSNSVKNNHYYLSSHVRQLRDSVTGESVTWENAFLTLTFSHVKANEEEISQGKVHETRVRQASSLARRVARKRWLNGNRTYLTETRCWRRPRPTIWAWKQRVASRISDFAAPLQKAMVQHHMGDLDKRIHRLASSGLPHWKLTII